MGPPALAARKPYATNPFPKKIMAKSKKTPAPASKTKKPAGKSVKPSPKPSAAAKKPAKAPPKPAPKSKPAVKKPEPKAATKPAAKAPLAKAVPVAKPTSEKAAPAKPAADAKASSRANLRSSILAKRAKPIKPIAFSLDEIREIAKTTVKAETAAPAVTPNGKGKAARQNLTEEIKVAKPQHIKAASLAEILGFNPQKVATPAPDVDDSVIPEKFRRYYRLLIDLRNHLLGQITTHSEETLKRSAKDDSGDLSSYGQHMADAGTDTFDRDFALSLVSSEQEALSEIEAAITRVKTGSYGICEITQKPIAKERLLAVPFTRYSAEAQKDIEKNRHRHRQQAGLFGEGEEGGKIMEDDSGDD